MIRNIVGKSVASAAVAGAAAPSTSFCKMQKPLPENKTCSKTGKVVEEWSLKEFEDDYLFFESSEIKKAVDDIMSLAPRAMVTAPSRVTISEVGSAQDICDVDCETSSSNLAMEEAEESMNSAIELQTQFSGILCTLLANPRVQEECLIALKNDPNFSEAIANVHAQGYLGRLDFNNLLPAAARSAAADIEAGAGDDGSGKDPVQKLMDAIGEGLKHFGQTVSHGCAAVGQFMIGLGFQLNSLLKRQFRPPSQAVRVGELRAPSPDIGLQEATKWFTTAIMTVACAVFALLVMRRIGARAAAH
eukprot:jgi/Botrbrau1/20960/Bobra.0135s0078.1